MRTSSVACSPSSVIRHAPQRRDEHNGITGNVDALEPRGCAGDDRDASRRNIEGAGDQPAQRVIGLPVGRRGAHPRLEHGTAVGQHVYSVDRITPAPRRETNVDNHAVRRCRPRLGRHGAQNTLGSM